MSGHLSPRHPGWYHDEQRMHWMKAGSFSTRPQQRAATGVAAPTGTVPPVFLRQSPQTHCCPAAANSSTCRNVNPAVQYPWKKVAQSVHSSVRGCCFEAERQEHVESVVLRGRFTVFRPGAVPLRVRKGRGSMGTTRRCRLIRPVSIHSAKKAHLTKKTHLLEL